MLEDFIEAVWRDGLVAALESLLVALVLSLAFGWFPVGGAQGRA